MKKRTVYALILTVSFVLLSVACVTVFAYMFRKTDMKNNQFTPAVVSCEVHEETDAGVTEKKSVRIKNTGNIHAYLRVRFVSYWIMTTEDGSSEIVSKPSEMPEFQIADGWLAGKDNTYYYKSPVSPDDFTEELLSSKIILLEEDGYQQVIEIFAEAIQSKPDSAVIESWNVILDANGNIISVS